MVLVNPWPNTPLGWTALAVETASWRPAEASNDSDGGNRPEKNLRFRDNFKTLGGITIVSLFRP